MVHSGREYIYSSTVLEYFHFMLLYTHLHLSDIFGFCRYRLLIPNYFKKATYYKDDDDRLSSAAVYYPHDLKHFMVPFSLHHELRLCIFSVPVVSQSKAKKAFMFKNAPSDYNVTVNIWSISSLHLFKNILSSYNRISRVCP